MAVIVNHAPDRRGLGLLASTGITLAASVVGAVVNFALAVLVGRAYGAGDTGSFFAAIGVFLVAANVVKLGADTGLVRMLARSVALGRNGDLWAVAVSALAPVLVVSVLVGALGYANADRIAGLLSAGEAPETAALVGLLAVGVPLLALFFLGAAVVRGLGAVVPFAVLTNVVLPLSRVAGVLVAIWWGWTILGATQLWAAGLPLLAVIAAAAALRALRRSEPWGLRRSEPWDAVTSQRARESSVFVAFWRFSLPRAASATIEISLEWFDVILVSVLAGPVEAGWYAVATRVVKVAAIADHALRVALSTRVSAALAGQDVAAVHRLYDLGTRLLLLIVWPYLAVLVVFGDVAMSVFGEEFGPGAALVGIVSIGMLVAAAAGSLQSVLLMSGLSTQQLTNKLAALAVSLLGNVCLTPAWGARGAAVVWVAAVCTDTALAARQVRRRLGIRVSWAPIRQMGGPAMVCGLGCAGAVRWIGGASLPALVIAGLTTLAVLSLVLRRSGELRRVTTLGGTAR